MKLVLLACLAALALLAAAVVSAKGGAKAMLATNVPRVRCDVAALRATLTAFVRAFNRGDTQRLDKLFSRDHFVWYSSGRPGLRVLPEATNRNSLAPYFERRHARNDRLTLLTFRFNSYERQRELGHFELTARRSADDFRAGRPLRISAKGALDCSRPPVSIAVLSVGGPPR